MFYVWASTENRIAQNSYIEFHGHKISHLDKGASSFFDVFKIFRVRPGPGDSIPCADYKID